MKISKKVSGSILVLSLLLPVAVFAENNGGNMMTPCRGGALFNFMTGEKCAASTTTTTPTVAYNASCASAAVIAEENSLQALRDTFNASMKTASMARRDALSAAFANTDATARATALKAAWDAFQTAQKAAQQTMMTSEKTLMQSFKTTMAGCGVNGIGMEDREDHMDMMGNDDGERGNSMMGQMMGKKSENGDNQGEGSQSKIMRKEIKKAPRAMMNGDRKPSVPPSTTSGQTPSTTTTQ
jgi:hypothetical protein